jgi:hypothetical protein
MMAITNHHHLYPLLYEAQLNCPKIRNWVSHYRLHGIDGPRPSSKDWVNQQLDGLLC